MISILHDTSLDSFTAAWVVKLLHPDAILYPIDTVNNLPFISKGITYLLGLSETNPELLRLLISGQLRVIHYDCQIGAEVVIPLLTKQFNASRYIGITSESKSTAGIAWDTLFGANPRPKLINLVEDAALNLFKYTNSSPFTTGLATLKPNMENWNYAFSKEGRNFIIDLGKNLLKHSI